MGEETRHRDDEEEEMRRAGIGNWFAYTDEDSFKKILNQMADIIEKHGLDWLAKISQEEETIVTKAMNEKLFLQHKELDREFIEEFHVKTVAQCEEDIDEWYRLINGIIEDIAGQSYEDAKEILVKIAAFIGERAYDVGFQKWEFVNKSVSVRRDNLAAPPWLTLPLPLNSVVSSWNEKYEQCEEEPNLVELCFNEIKKMFLYPKEKAEAEAMNKKLFSQHKELDKEFIEEFHVKAVAQCEEDIDEWYHLIKGMIADIAGQPYENVKEMLLKMAAFIGERACELCSHKWKMTTSVMVFGDNYYAPISPLVCVKGEWDYKSKCEAQGEEKNLLAPIDLEQGFEELKRAFLEQEDEI